MPVRKGSDGRFARGEDVPRDKYRNRINTCACGCGQACYGKYYRGHFWMDKRADPVWRAQSEARRIRREMPKPPPALFMDQLCRVLAEVKR